MSSSDNLIVNLRDWVSQVAPGGYWLVGGTPSLDYLYLTFTQSYSDDDVSFRPEDLVRFLDDVQAAPGLRSEIARLRAAIETARHPESCETKIAVNFGEAPGPCDCWIGRALNGP